MQALDPLADRLEVGEQAAEPTPVDVRHLATLRPLLDRVTGLLLGPDEEDHPALRRHLRDELGRLLQQLLGLEEIDDVDPLPLSIDEAAHAWVPSPRLVTEVNPGLQQLLDAYVGHLTFLSLVWFEGAPPRSDPFCVSPVAAAGTRVCPGSLPCLSAGVGCKARGIVGVERRTAGVMRKTGKEGRRDQPLAEDLASSSGIPGKSRQLVAFFGYSEGTHQSGQDPRSAPQGLPFLSCFSGPPPALRGGPPAAPR